MRAESVISRNRLFSRSQPPFCFALFAHAPSFDQRRWPQNREFLDFGADCIWVDPALVAALDSPSVDGRSSERPLERGRRGPKGVPKDARLPTGYGPRLQPRFDRIARGAVSTERPSVAAPAPLDCESVGHKISA
jgi:hypothetical protein